MPIPDERWPHQIIGRVHTSSNALLPLLWLCGLITLPAWGMAAWVVSNWLQVALFLAGTAPPLCAGYAYLRLLFKDPDRLQSERYQLTRLHYSLLGDDLHRGQVIEGSAEEIQNPLLSNEDAQHGA